MRLLFLSLAIGLLLSSSGEALPAQVILIRHGEKPPTGNNLSLKGEQRAAALVPFFLGNPELLQFGTPVAIYAEKPSSKGTAIRALETITPLANALNLTPITTFESGQVKELADEILTTPAYKGKMVLICWEHKEIPKIAEKLGAKDAPPKWGNVFDRYWMINYEFALDGTVDSTFNSNPQELLFGDSAK